MNIEDITDQEKNILKSLVNPDEPKEKKYQWDFRYQQEVLSMLLMDRHFLIQSMQLIKPFYFVEKAHEAICSIVFNYFNKYKQLPPKFVIANEIREKYDPKKALVYNGELETLTATYVSGLHSRDACLDKITEFAKEQALRNAVSLTLDLLDKNRKDKWDRIEAAFREAITTDKSFDVGLNYFETLDDRYERMLEQSKQKEVFITGFESIDDGLSSGGLSRGEIGAFIGMAGSGKSILLVKTAVKNLLRGKKVLYISLEMDQDKLARRFDAMLARENIRTLVERREFVLESLKSHMNDEEDKRSLIIKQFAAGTADMNTIRAYMSQLKLYGFKPDLLLVDYVGEFKDDPSVKTYESRQRIVRDLRGFGVEENHCTFTALQSNRMGREAQEGSVIDDDAIGDSYGQVRPLDALWSINQSINEKELGVGKIFVIKHRDGRSRYHLYFKQDKETLDLIEISRETHGELLSQWSTKNGDSKFSGKFKPNGR